MNMVRGEGARVGAQDTVKYPENKPMRKAVGVSVAVTTFFYIAVGVFGCARGFGLPGG